MNRRLNVYWLKQVCYKAPGPLSFLICINNLSDNLLSTAKLFADDTIFFSLVHDSDISANELNKSLSKIFEWAYKWKIFFNPDLNKQAQKVIFSRKTKLVISSKNNF